MKERSKHTLLKENNARWLQGIEGNGMVKVAPEFSDRKKVSLNGEIRYINKCRIFVRKKGGTADYSVLIGTEFYFLKRE